MSTQLQIPVELLELIIDNVDFESPEGQQTLAAFSSTNRSFVAMCQKRIFRDVQLRQKLDRSTLIWVFTEPRGSDGDRFLELITTQESCHLAKYVRNLTINIDEVLSYGFPKSNRDKTDRTSVKPDYPLYASVPLLRNLKKISVISSVTKLSSIPWDSLEGRIHQFLSELIQRLPEIDFRFFSSIPIVTFHKSSALKVLHISCADIRKRIKPPSSRTHLRFLDVGYCLPPTFNLSKYILQNFDPTHSALDITHLTGLKLSSTNFFPSDVDNILALCANTLESLDLVVGQYGNCILSYSSQSVISPSLATPPNLTSLHNLRSLTLRTLMHYDPFQQDFESTTLFIPSILHTLPNNTHSPTFELVLDTLFSQPIERLATFPWSDIVDALDQARFPHNFVTVKLIFRQRQDRQEGDRILDATHLSEILDRNDDMRRLGKKYISLVSTSAGVDH